MVDTSFKEKLTLRDFLNFHSTTQKSELFTSMSSFSPTYVRFELRKYRGVIFMTLNSDTKFE